MDVAAVAALVIGLVLGARGVGIMPQGSSPNPMTTQSVAAAAATATATETLATDGAGTNRQPGPGPRVAPALVDQVGQSLKLEGDPVLSNGVVYAVSPITTGRFAIVGYDPTALEIVWSSEHSGRAIDFTVWNSSISIIAQQSDGRSTVINQQAGSVEQGWTVDLPFDALAVTRSSDTVLVSGHDESTGTPNAGEPGDMSRLVAIDSADHSIRWDIKLTNPAGVEPLLMGDAIFYTTANGAAKAIETASGEPRWTTGTGGLRITSQAVAEGGLVYVIRPDGVVSAFDRETGTQRWGKGLLSEDLGVPPLTTIIGGDNERAVPAPILALSASGQLIVGYVWSNADLSQQVIAPVPVRPESLEITLVALDAATGSRLWSHFAGTPYDNASEHVEFGLTITGNQLLINGGAFFSMCSVDSGTPLWNVAVAGSHSGSTIVTDHAVIVSGDYGLSALREPVLLPGTATPAATPTG